MNIDEITVLVKKLQTDIQHTVRTADDDSSPALLLPNPARRANTFLTFDSKGNLYPGVVLPSGVLSQANIAQFLWPQTPAETTAKTTAILCQFPPGNVLRYGADPSGNTPSEVSIQAAINFASVSGGTVIIPAGIYRLNATLYIDSTRVKGGIRIIGDGWQKMTNSFDTYSGTRLHYFGSGTAISITGVDAATQVDNVLLEAFTVENKGPASSTGVGIHLNQGRWHELRDLYVGGFSTGIEATQTWMCKYSRLLVMNNATYGCNFHDSGEDSYFDTCFFRYNGNANFVLQRSQNCTFTECDFSNSPRGLVLFNSANASIPCAILHGAIFENCTTTGIELNADDRSTWDHYPKLIMFGGRFWNTGKAGSAAITATRWNTIYLVGVPCNYQNLIDTTKGPGNVSLIHIIAPTFTGTGAICVGSVSMLRVSDHTYNKANPISDTEMQNGWSNLTAEGSPSYSRNPDGMVQLSGFIAGGMIGKTAFVLPPGFRPATMSRFGCSAGGRFGECSVSQNGEVTPETGGVSRFSLCGIAFATAQ